MENLFLKEFILIKAIVGFKGNFFLTKSNLAISIGITGLESGNLRGDISLSIMSTFL